jgi:cysteine desulfurase
MIYLDHNASTSVDERVLDAMLPYLRQLYGNPSSLYRLGRISKSAIDTAREQVASLVDAPAGHIVFTSGGTEANALALTGAWGKRLWVSAIEHPSIVENVVARAERFAAISVLAVQADGMVSEQSICEQALCAGDFATVMLANNETGAVQPVARLAEDAKQRGVLMHTDAVQAIGKMPISFRQLGVDLMSLSSHKIYGPKGCGALVHRAGVALTPLQCGGDQEQGFRAGTENVAAIVGFGKAAELAAIELDRRITRLKALRIRLEHHLKAFPGVVIFAEQIERLPNTVQFGLPGVDGEMLLMQLDQKTIAVSSGSACKSGSEQASPVLKAMGVEVGLARSAIRVSLGKDNTEQEIDQFAGVMKSLLAAH